MITANPITISTPTRFQVSFELTPPYTTDEVKVAGDGTWSVQCGVVELEGSNPVEYSSIFTEGAHNIPPHKGEPVPCVTWMSVERAANFDSTPWDPDYPNGTYAIAMAPVPHGTEGHFDKLWTVYTLKAGAGAPPKPGVQTPSHAWHVEVNVIHGTEEEVRDAHRRRRAGCLIPWWWWPLPLGTDYAGALYQRMLRDGEIRVAPERPRTRREDNRAAPAAKKKKTARRAPKRPK